MLRVRPTLVLGDCHAFDLGARPPRVRFEFEDSVSLRVIYTTLA